jgi:hypothetical protein
MPPNAWLITSIVTIIVVFILFFGQASLIYMPITLIAVLSASILMALILSLPLVNS